MRDMITGEPITWSRLGRGERLVMVAEQFSTIARRRLTAWNLAETWSAMAELCAVLESCEDGSSLYSSMHPDAYEREAYQASGAAKEELDAQVRSEGFVEDLERMLLDTAREHIDAIDDRQVVWFIEGRFPDGARGREMLVYLALRQVHANEWRRALTRTYQAPSMVPAGIVVQTPRWVAAYLSTLAGCSVSETFELDEEGIDYLSGLWRGGWPKEGLDPVEAIRAASLLARARRERGTRR